MAGDAVIVLYIGIGIIAGVNLFIRLADRVLDERMFPITVAGVAATGLAIFAVLYISLLIAAIWPLYAFALLVRHMSRRYVQ